MFDCNNLNVYVMLEINSRFTCACVPNIEIDGEYGNVMICKHDVTKSRLKENNFGQVE